MIVTRFAPSPTGLLHLGHAYSAILNHDAARAHGGRFLLRIEDIDRGRCRPEFEEAIYEDLAWLGLSWDAPLLRQSERMAAYRDGLEALRDRGLVYRCFLTRAEVAEAMSAPHGPASAFKGAPLPPAEETARLEANEPFAWRLDMDAAVAAMGVLPVTEIVDGARHTRAADPARHGDVVLARKDVGTSYHLASVTDDIATGVTDVIRGEDLKEAADLHVLLYALFGSAPPTYRHHPLVTDEGGRRLAKRDRSKTLRSLADAGETPLSVRARLDLRKG
ncbi:tRNA glutamyl-Q(34) synthetase GluQRS [Parvularcula dongshanensis]|uniref:Glutamyl-Q tRNA(Asp) synthetase n=1 Tax=Parvularcula dongshanensis TaxID=1173995 RepID=A0A840I2K7_9PROT|nr:tRNA glutamyl-Q(34) synthetase GluQRS [Parvularcula dongshanensis]MBB4658532.1 glutamyl-Q tRNA(Asp) synthetase [Parvularcula dongshanensis]